MDRILIEGMSFFGHHGVEAAEREVGTHFTVDVALELDVSEAGRSDQLEDTLDYREAYGAVREVLEGDRCQLLESLAQRSAERLLALDRVQRATVAVRKRPPLPVAIGSAGGGGSRGRWGASRTSSARGASRGGWRSGDMTLGALLDAGADPSILDAAVYTLGLADEVRVESRHEERGHLGGIRVRVECAEGPSRTLPELEQVVRTARLPDRVRDRGLEALARLGQAEAAVHGRPPEQLHLHELGGADTLVDLVGAFWLLESLDVDRVHASPLPAPRGRHSAPGTLRVLEGTGVVLEPDERKAELVTPTGAAILATVATFE